jgi:hypothetical protein
LLFLVILCDLANFLVTPNCEQVRAEPSWPIEWRDLPRLSSVDMHRLRFSKR